MAQIIGRAAKPKRANINGLTEDSLLYNSILDEGEYLLLSSDNSMSITGEGRFDKYVVGDGSTMVKDLIVRDIDVIGDKPIIRTNTYLRTSLVLGYFRFEGLNVGSTFNRDFRTSTTKYAGMIRLLEGDSISLNTYATSGTTGVLVPYCVVSDKNVILAIDNTNNPADYSSEAFNYTATENCTIFVACNSDKLSIFKAVVTRKVAKKLKICVIGNSYSLDSFMYLPFILLNFGITSKVGVYYRSSGSLQNQVSEFTSGSNPFYTIDTDTELTWAENLSYSPQLAIKDDAWDIVVIQQSSTASLDINTYEPYTRQLVNLIATAINKPFVLAWNININRFAGDIATEQGAILQNIKATTDTEPVSFIFPYGTAIFDARTNSTLDALGDGGHLWASDKVHLQEGIPCYIAALANTQKLFERYYPDKSVLGDITIPDAGSIAVWNVKGQQGTPVGVNDNNRRLSQVCAIAANTNPFAVKNIP